MINEIKDFDYVLEAELMPCMHNSAQGYKVC